MIVAEWLNVLRKAYPLVRLPIEYQASLKRAFELAQQYPDHYLAAKTSEYTAFGLANQFRFSEATTAYVRTKRLALAAGDPQTAAFASHALSNIYLSAGNLPGALEAARQAVASVPAGAPPEVRATFQIHLARLLARNGRVSESGPMFAEAIETAERLALWGVLADAWKLAGLEMGLQGDLASAEFALRTSLRWRHLHHDPEMASDYHDLSDICFRAGRPAEALGVLALADRRVATSKRFSAWRLHLLKGRIQLALGRTDEALAALRRAIAGIDASPLFAAAGDLLRSQVARPTEAHELFAAAAWVEFQRTGDRSLLNQAFAAAEASRAAALRAASTDIPVASRNRYWKIVADLDEATARLLARNDEATRRRVDQLRLSLAELETSFDWASESASRLAAAPPLRLLNEDEALISFQLGDQFSLVWTVARGRLEATRLPSRSVVQRQLQGWLNAAAGEERQRQAHGLYRQLLGALPPEVHAARHWLVAADGELFQAPWSTLVTRFETSTPVYVAQLHDVQLIPGAWTLERRRPTVRTGRFLAVGDPIYNEGDPRRGGAHWSWRGQAAETMELTRLAGSAAEVTACSKFWPSAKILLGERSVPEEFSRELERAPAVVHLAIHVVPAPDSPRENLVALGVGSEGRPAFIGPEWIGAHRLPGSLVVMNGCRSGSGRVSAGEGLMGLTRAWLRAGASRVLSTYWPTPDDGGALIAEFYRQITGAHVSTAEALRRAQVSMIRQSGWRADPQYWGAYFLIGYPD